ncbi:MAG: methylase [Salinivirgaceae bacterium]|nr:methylase [Salinivirgaceae bacterium]
MAWMRTICGRLKSDYRYSNDIIYNNFPFPKVSEQQKQKIIKTAESILDTRAQYVGSSLADLYYKLTLPKDLLRAHQANDEAVMEAYGFNAKMTEKEIVGELYKMYEKLTSKQPETKRKRK